MNVTSTNHNLQQRYFNILIKLIYFNTLLINDKTLQSVNLATDFDATKDMTSFYQMNRNNGVIKDRRSNRNIKTILQQNPSIFDDLQMCFIKISQGQKKIGEDHYKERMIQVIFLFVYLLIAAKGQSDIDPVYILMQSKDYLFKNQHTIKYGMLLFMLIFSDKYNKSSCDFKRLFINSPDGLDNLIIKLNESENEEQLMRNLYLVCLICLETSKELKVKVIRRIDLLSLFDHIKVFQLSIENQRTLISYIIEMCCLSNEMLYFPIQDQLALKQLFSSKEMHYVKSVIDNAFINLSEYLPKDEEDGIYYTENDFLSASQANFNVYMEEEEEQSVREAFAFIESDFLNSMFIILFQLDKRLKVEFLSSLIPLIELRSECRRVLSKMEILEFFLRLYQYHRDLLVESANSDEYEIDCEFLNLLLKLISFCLSSGVTVEDDMYLYSLIKWPKSASIDENLLLMLCHQVEYCDIPNCINFKETVDSFGLAAFISRGQALQKFEGEICLSNYVTNIPNKKKGWCANFWFRLKKLYDNMNILSMVDFKGEKMLKISLNIIREFESVAIENRLGISNYQANLGDIFSRPKIRKLLEVRYAKDEVYVKESIEIPFELEINKVYHFYCR